MLPRVELHPKLTLGTLPTPVGMSFSDALAPELHRNLGKSLSPSLQELLIMLIIPTLNEGAHRSSMYHLDSRESGMVAESGMAAGILLLSIWSLRVRLIDLGRWFSDQHSLQRTVG